MKKQIIISVLISLVIAGILGFYTGRYFEQKKMRSRFQPRNGEGPQQRQFNGIHTETNN